MSHVTINPILSHARRHGYGVPNLWCGSSEQAIGYIAAAEKLSAPLCICFNRELCPDLPVEIGVPLIVNAAKIARIPVATVLDHGRDMESAVQAIHAGISSVMFDGSRLPFEENLRRTAEIVQVAHAAGVAVEAELGAVGGSALENGGADSTECSMTDPGQAEEFVSRTGIDALAISFGNFHGVYQGKPCLDLQRVKRIASVVPVPLVMHGASGLKDEDYAAIIESGISKINYYTAHSQRVCENIRTRISEHPNFGFHDLMKWSTHFFMEDSMRLIALFGGKDKALGIANLLRNS